MLLDRLRLELRSRARSRALLARLAPSSPFDLQSLGKTLLHASLVGVGAGVVGAAFFASLEFVQRLVLEEAVGYVPLRAAGEGIVGSPAAPVFRPWLLLVVPALGALLGGLVSNLAPETRGGGGDATIRAFHRHGGAVRRRVLWVKPLASILTLGSGGSGGREGPTMHLGAALGAFVGRTLKVSAYERRILAVAGVAAGMSAVFRTPLGAALLAVEVLYRDDFEAEALVPAVLASVVSYSVVISIFGESTLFARAARYPFVPAHLPLYALMAIGIALLAVVFVRTLRAVERTAARVPVPPWLRPGLGGLALGVVAVPLVVFLGDRIHRPGAGLGVLGGGYGAAQMAITGSPWLPEGWSGVQLLLGLCLAKLVATSLTIGSGGSAGDFGPSLVLGGLFGGAFGRAAQILLGDPRIDPGAFALVGMGTFYGGIAHVPLSSLILVSELAGTYDLLVPLMLAEGIAFVALRGHSLYRAQVPNRLASPVHGDRSQLDVLGRIGVAEVLVPRPDFVRLDPRTTAAEIMRRTEDASWQLVFPVLDEDGGLRGLVTNETLRVLAMEREVEPWAIAADVMGPPVTVRRGDDLRVAAEALVTSGLHQLPVLGDDGTIVGFLDEADVARAYLASTSLRPATDSLMPSSLR